MAGKIPVGSLITDIKLNGDQPVKTLRELRQAVSSTTSAWKAQEAVLRSAGKTTEAAETKYKGLSDAVKSQRRLIDGLVEKQKSLKKQQEEIDTSTDKGKKAYESISTAIQKNATQTLKATSRLESLTKQQDKAKNSLTYYRSGLAEAQKTLKTTTAVSKSYVDRLESEGNHYKANEARISGYRSSISNLTKQYEIQSRELKRIASESGATSEAYKRQQIRVNETAASLNKAKSAVSGLEAEQRKINPTPWDRLKVKISSVNKESQETHRTLKEVFMGSALGNAVSNAVSNLGSSLKSAYTEGMNLNLAIAKINGRFKGMGMSEKQVQGLDKQIGELKANTAMTGNNVADLQAHMLNWSSIGTKGAMQMARTIAGVGDSSKLTGDQIERVGASLQRVGSTGKVTYSSLSRITKAAPTFMAQLAKGAGMSQSKMTALLKTGDVTQKQFQKWMANASKYSDEAFKGFGQSQAGALKQMTVAKQKLEQAFTKPIFDAKTSGLQALRNIMTSKEVLSGANALGKAISNAVGYLDKHKADITGVTKDVVSLGVSIGKETWKDASGIIMDIGKSFGLISGNAKKSKDPLHVLKLSMDGLAKNKTAIQWISKSIIAIAAAKGIGHVGMNLLGIANNGYKAYKNIKALRSGFKGLQDIKKFTGAEHAFAHLGQTIGKLAPKVKGLFNQKGGAGKLSGLLQSAHSAGGFSKLSTAGKIGTGLAGAGVAVDTATSIVKAIKDKVGSRKQYEDVGTAAGKGIGGAIGLYFGGPLGAAVGAKIGATVGKWGGDAVKSFQNGWNKKKPSRKFWSLENLGWSTHDTFRKVGKWGADVGKKLGQGLRKGKSFAKKNSKELALTAVSPLLGIPALLYKNNPKFRKWANGVGKNIKSGLSKAGKAVNHFKSSLSKNFKKAWDNVYKHSSKGTKQIMRSVSKFTKNYVKINSKANKETLKNFSSFGARLKKNHGNLFKTLGQTAKTQLAIEKHRWSANWKNIRSAARGIWKGINQNASDMYKKLNSATHGGLGKVFSGFKSFGNSIKSFWTNLWKGIIQTFQNTIKGLQNAAGNVKKFFTGKLKVGSLHLAEGTDWKKKYGYPAILNDGFDSPATNNKEGILNPDGSVEVQQGVNVPRWIFPWQDVINARDMAKLFGRSVHLASGTVDLHSLEGKSPAKILGNLTKLLKKKYDEDRLRHQKQKERHNRNDASTANERKRLIKHEQDDKADRAKVAKEIRDVLKHGRNTKGLIAQLNKLTSRISRDRKAVAKTNPHHGKTLVDEGLLLGANSRIGKSKWISDALFKKLTTAPKTKKRKTKKRKSTRRRSTSTSRRSYSSRSSRVSVSNVSVSGASLKGLSSKSISVTAKVKGSKQIKALEKAMKRIKGGTHKVTVKTKGAKSVKSLAKAIKRVKGKKSTVSVKTKGTSQLKSLHKNINTVEKRLNVLAKTAKKDKFGEQISKQAEKAVKSLEGKGNFTKKISSMSKATVKDFKLMTSSVGKTTDKIRKSTEQDFSNLYKRSYQSVKRLHDGVIKLGTATARGFGGAMHKMVGYASDSMRGTIRQINRGIRGIDAVLKQFGGNSSVINPVHFAKGTDANGRLTHDTLAVVNDAQSGPRQEAVVTDQNDIIIPHGNNRKMLLRKGWGVLNGTQTQSLSLPHFANGTGINKKELRKLAENSLKHFIESFKSMFTNNLHDVGSSLTKDAINLSKRSGTHYGDPWSQAIWMVINKAIGSGGGSRMAFLRYAKETFDGVKYQMGAASKTLSDCSGMVMQALRHFGINIGRTTVAMQESSGVQYLGKNLAKTEPGDLVIFGHGTGAAGHVGIINNPAKGTMFNETPPYARISKISDAMSMGYGYYRVKGLHDQTKHQPKIKPSLLALAKRELGGKALNWIGDHLSENEDGVGGKPTGDHLHWLKQAGIPESWWHYMELIIDGGNGIQGESHWNPRIINPSSGAYGIPQSLPASKMASAGRDWRTNAITQLRWMKDYIRGRYGTAKAAWEHKVNTSTHWYANGGIASSPSIFGEAGPEMAVPLIPSKSTRAWELIGKAVGILTANSNLSANQQRISNKDEKDEHDLLKAVLLVLQKMSAQSRDIHITLETPEGRKLWELVEPFYKQDRRQDMIKERRGLSARFR